MDMRILIEGEEYGRRHPGGFMRLPGDYEISEANDYSNKSAITYAGWASDFSRNVTLPMQRAIIDQYCEKNKIEMPTYDNDLLKKISMWGFVYDKDSLQIKMVKGYVYPKSPRFI